MPDYAAIRRREAAHIADSLKTDRAMKRAIGKIYRNSAEEIQRHIDADIMRFATREGVSITEARKIISKTDVEAFQSTAKRYVEDRDFSPRANKELRRYNVTMRTNRLELLESRINLELIDLALEEERLTEKYIIQEGIKEYKRQSGILGMSTPSQSTLQRLARSVALSDVRGATFSDRIWANQNELRNEINMTIERALMRGENPRTSAASIKRLVRDEYGMKKRAADRIAITEVGRSQIIAQQESYKDAGINQYIFISEPDACPICKDLDDQVFNLKTMVIGENAPVMHPFAGAPQPLMLSSCGA